MDDWIIVYDTYDPEKERKQEALCTLGNGYFATRGAAEESTANQLHYPGTYLAGGYNRLQSEVSGKMIENEDLVNWPNWLTLTFKPKEGQWLDLDKMKLIKYEKRLNLREGLLERDFVVEDGHKRQTQLQTRRLVHIGAEHFGAIQWHLKPLNWSGEIVIKSALDGHVINNGVARYSDLNGQHLQPREAGAFGEKGIYLKVQTSQSEITMAQAARTEVHHEGTEITINRVRQTNEDYVEELLNFEVEQELTYVIEKVVSIYSSKDDAISEPLIEAKKAIRRAPGFDRLASQQEREWGIYWRRCDLTMESNGNHDQLLLRLHIFHLLQTTSMNTIDLDVGVPSRGLHGEAYRGHIFWDELFIFPFINFRIPEITRALLMYRYRRMDEARYLAREAGFEGAMFPWQSGSDGREESQVIHLNPQSGNWIPDNTYLQRHINAAIAYNVWQYYQVTDDYEFLSFYGAEMLLQIGRFWASKAQYNKERDRYEIHHVVGPDEYHTQYPGSDSLGLNNNAYTNIMAVWTLKTAKAALEVLDKERRKEIFSHIGMKEDDLERWEQIQEKMYLPVNDDHIIYQFEGWEELEELDWDRFHDKYGEILRLDRILEKENDNPNRYKASKQPDVLMLFYLLSSEELGSLLNKMGYDFTPEWIPKNINYYKKRTSHGSTLSKMVESWVLARKNRSQSWHNFTKALVSDFNDIQGGTTSEGIHLGAMAGTLDLVQRCYTGLEFRENTLIFNPSFPKDLKCIHMRLRYRGRWIIVDLDQNRLKVTCDGGRQVAINMKVADTELSFEMGDTQVFELGEKAAVS